MNVLARPWMFWGLTGIMALGLRSGAWSETEAAGPAAPADSANAEPAGELLAEAEQAVQAGDLERAVEFYEALAAAGDAETVAWARLGRAACQLRLGRLADAEETLHLLLPPPEGPLPEPPGPTPLRAQAHALLADLSLQQMDYGAAVTHRLARLLLHPIPSAMREAGEGATYWSDPDDLREKYEALLEEAGGGSEEEREEQVERWVRYHEVYFLAYQGDTVKARATFEALLQQEPEGPLAGAFWLELATLARSEGDLQGAAEQYERALAQAEAQGDEFPVARLHLGYVYEKLGRTAEAQAQFARILEKSPLHKVGAAAGIELANLCKCLGRYEEALRALTWVEKHFPENQLGALQQAREMRARVLLAQGQYEAVEREVWDLCGYYPAARPAAAKILVDLAEAQLKVSHLEEVRRLTEAVARELPEQEEECVRARVVAARALRQSGDVEGAAIALRAVIEEQPTQPWAGGAALELAGLSRERHDPATAEGSYRWVLEHHRDSEWAAAAAQGLPALLVETEQVKEALAELETLAEQFANRPDVAAEAWIAAGDVLCAAARVEQGRQLYQEVAQRFPTAREPSARAALHLAESYQTTGQEEEAAPRFAQLRQDFPELWEAGAAGLHLGRYYARQKDYDRAVEVWQQVLQAFPQVGWLAAPSLKELGLAYKETGEFEKSEEVLLRLRDEYAQEVDEAASAQLHLGYLYEKQGLYEKAEAAFQATVERYPGQSAAAPAVVELANLYCKTKRYGEALDFLERAENQFADSGWFDSIAKAKAGVLLAVGDLDACAQYVRSILERRPTARPLVAKLLLETGKACLKVDRLEQAQQIFNEVLAYFPETGEGGDLCLQVGDLYLFDKRDFQAARKIYEELLVRAPQGSRLGGTARLRLGRVFQEQMKIQEAVAEYERVIADCADDRELCARAQLHIGYAYGKANEYERAYSELRKVREEYPEQTSLVAAAEKEVGLYLHYQGNYHEAIQQLEHVLTEYPEEEYNAAMALYPLGCSYFICEKYEKAIEAFQRCVEEHPNAGFPMQAQFYLAVSYYLTEQYHESIAEVDKFIQTSPPEPETIHMLFIKGLCCLAQGEYPSALTFFQEINKVSPMGASLAGSCVQVTRQFMDTDKRYSGSDFGTRYLPLIKQAAIAILKISPAFLGDVAYNKTRLKKAEEFLRQCESQEGAYQQLTHYLYSQGDYDLAVQIGEEYLRSLPRNQTVAAAIGGDVGRSLEALGRYAEAAKVYEKMVADNPTDTNLSAVIQYHVVQLYRRLDETAAARTAAEKLLKEFPESREAALIRDEVAQGQGSPHP